MRMDRFTRRGLGLVVATAGAMSVLGAGTATAQEVPPIPRGMQQVVTDILGPQDAGFWDPAVPGTRVLTPVGPGVSVACATGFEPVISCSTLDMFTQGAAQRSLQFVDVPTLGGPLRMWFDYPRWGDGSTGAVNAKVIETFTRN